MNKLVQEMGKTITGGTAAIKKRVIYYFDENEELERKNTISFFEEIGWRDPFFKETNEKSSKSKSKSKVNDMLRRKKTSMVLDF